MKNSARTLIVVVLALIASPTLSNAQIRGAGSKILGNYDHFDQSAPIRPAPSYSGLQYPATNQGSGQPAQVAQQSAGRAYSYDAGKQAPPCAAVAPATEAIRRTTPTQAVRRFSYAPGYVAPGSRFAPSRGWQSGVRDAGSKIRGDY